MAAAPASRPRLVALDTNIILHLAENYAPAHNLVLALVRKGFTPIITQTVIHELGHFAQESTLTPRQTAAVKALLNLRKWGVQPCALKPVGNGISGVVADVIANRGLLPEAERNDAYIVIEASFFGVSMLVTWDGHLLNTSNERLNEVLQSFDLPPIRIVNPQIILGY